MKEILIKSIIEMLDGINDVKALERIHRFIQYIYISR